MIDSLPRNAPNEGQEVKEEVENPAIDVDGSGSTYLENLVHNTFLGAQLLLGEDWHASEVNP